MDTLSVETQGNLLALPPVSGDKGGVFLARWQFPPVNGDNRGTRQVDETLEVQRRNLEEGKESGLSQLNGKK